MLGQNFKARFLEFSFLRFLEDGERDSKKNIRPIEKNQTDLASELNYLLFEPKKFDKSSI